MLKNKWFLGAVAVLLAAAVAYDVWYFFLRDEERPSGRVVGSAAAAGSPPPAAGAAAAADGGRSAGEAADTAGARRSAELIRAAARGRPALRDSAALAGIRSGSDGGDAWGREPLARSGVLAPDRRRDTAATDRRAAPPGWELAAVMVGRDRRAAVIDGRVVRVGDPVRGDGRVVEIRRSSVVIRWRDRRIVVQLPVPD